MLVALLAAVALLGLLVALYFVLVTYRAIRPDSRLVPAFCRMDEATCARVVDTPEARVFGLPNAAYGLAWYAAVLAYALVGAPDGARLPFLFVGAATVLFSMWLAWALVFRLRTLCPLCFVGHAANAAIVVLLSFIP